mmetsp:Transcript_23508/g.48931  ORF Transcript_23508/g.48931 Transcript_23508/m.48931 type:complete len:262 (+) Transcript_23508:502-1287(+)
MPPPQGVARRVLLASQTPEHRAYLQPQLVLTLCSAQATFGLLGIRQAARASLAPTPPSPGPRPGPPREGSGAAGAGRRAAAGAAAPRRARRPARAAGPRPSAQRAPAGGARAPRPRGPAPPHVPGAPPLRATPLPSARWARPPQSGPCPTVRCAALARVHGPRAHKSHRCDGWAASRPRSAPCGREASPAERAASPCAQHLHRRCGSPARAAAASRGSSRCGAAAGSAPPPGPLRPRSRGQTPWRGKVLHAVEHQRYPPPR